MGKKVCIEVYLGKIGVKYVFFCAKKVLTYAIFGVKLFPKIYVCVRFVTNSMSELRPSCCGAAPVRG